MPRPISHDARAFLAAAVPGVDLTRVSITELADDGRLAAALVRRRIEAITIGRRVIAPGRLDELDPQARETLVHELVHVRQVTETGLTRFYWRYLADYLSGRRKGLGHNDAYRAIPFEEEAYRLARLTRQDWD